jgi:hypothetical protein
VLREAEGGRLYLDEPSWQALRFIRRRIAMVLITIIVFLGVVTFLVAQR